MRTKRKIRRAMLLERIGNENRFMYGTGIEGINWIFQSFQAHNHVVVVGMLHEGVKNLLKRFGKKYHVELEFLSNPTVNEIEETITNHTGAIYHMIQSLNEEQIELISELAKMHGLKYIIDNGSARPYIDEPSRIGADIILHSGTTYIPGYSDIVAGLIVIDRRTT